MNIAIIIAGGQGTRLNGGIPKQFIEVQQKPIIIYTLEHFQECNEIDKIFIACIHGWEEKLKDYIKKFNITKVCELVPGGHTGFQSIKNCIDYIAKQDFIHHNDIVLIHDAVRPIIRKKNILEAIRVAKTKGNAISVSSIYEALIVNKKTSIPIDNIQKIKAPQAFIFGDLKDTYDQAHKKKITNSVTTATLFLDFGKELYFIKSDSCNIKITTKKDLFLFRALQKIKGKK